MSIKMSKLKELLFALTCFFSSFIIMWQCYEVVIINELYIAFPDNAGIITGILSWPAIVTAAASFLAGSLLKKLSTKTELIMASVMLLAGLLPIFSANVYVLLISSIIMAAAAGFSNTAGMAIIGEVYSDGNRRSQMMGWYNAAMSILGCCISMAGGVLAIQGWQVGFNLYWVVIPMLVMCILFLPDIRPQDRAAEGMEESSESKKGGLGGRFWLFYIAACVFFVAYCPFFSFISVYISENNLGGTDFIGIASTLTTVGSFVAGLIFGVLFARLHRSLNLMSYILPIGVYAMLYLFPCRTTVIAGSLIYGLCYGCVFTFIYAYPGYCVPMDKMGFVMGLMTVNYSVAIFLGVYVAQWLMAANGGSITATYPAAILILAVSAVLELVGCIKDKKDKLFEQAE
jgi:MFS family permease